MPNLALERAIIGAKKKSAGAPAGLIIRAFTPVKGNGTTFNPAVPTGLVGEPLLFFSTDGGAIAGWTTTQGQGSFGGSIWLHTRIADGSEPGTIVRGDGGLSGYGSHHGILRIQGGTAIENIDGTGGNWGPTSPQPSKAISTTTPNDMVFQFAHVQGSAAGFINPPAGWTVVYNDFQLNGAADATRNGAVIVLAKLRPAAGAEPSFNFEWGAAGATSTSFTEIACAVR